MFRNPLRRAARGLAPVRGEHAIDFNSLADSGLAADTLNPAFESKPGSGDDASLEREAQPRLDV
jgi:hypothetical protein